VEAMTMGQRIAVMRDGLLQQCDDPENVYNKPANRFVAGFIGAPPMNFLSATLMGTSLDLGPFKIAVPTGHPASGMTGKSVTVGIRPEDIYDAKNTTIPVTPDNSFEAKVDVLEKLGAEDTAYILAGDKNLIASLDPATRIEAGESARFAVDLDKIHIFDGETEQAIR
jgi:multiple sugar transport system ATP-binding protein